jgi:dTDP-4-dehydrorhamnose reductase
LAKEEEEMRVVDDQWGAPTSVGMLARAVPAVIGRAACDDSLLGLYHMSAAGRTTWCRFARAILGREVVPISSDEYQMRARRPKNSVLDNSKLNSVFGICLPSWEQGLMETLTTWKPL